MRPKILALALSLSLLTVVVPAAHADQGSPVFTDTFTDTSKVDLNATTALVDTTDGWVELWHPSQSMALSVDQAQDPGWPSNIVVADQGGVQWYTFDQSSGKMQRVDAFGYSYANPVGVALVPQTMNYWVLTRGSGDTYDIKQAVWSGSGMVDNPIVAVAGLSAIVTIAAVDSGSVAVADKNGRVTVYNQGAVDASHSFDTGLTDIQSVISIPGTWNFVVVTKGGAYQYVYDQGSGKYVQNSVYTIQAGSQMIVAGASSDSGNLVDLLAPDQNRAYVFNQSSGQMAQAGVYTIGGLNGAIAVGLPSDQVVVIADQGGTVHTYQYSGGSFAENPNLQINGLKFTTDYHSPGTYQSVPINPPGQNNMFEIIPTEQNDPGTSISYALSVDGGKTFVPVQPNTWVHLPPNTFNPPAGANVPPGPYIIQATLTSPSRDATPRLTDIELRAYLDITPPTAPGQPTANPSPSGQQVTHITWDPADDVLSAPSTGVSGVATYQIRFSTDGVTTWGPWINTGSNQPGYDLQVPDNTAITYAIQVRAIDNAGNIGPESPIGTLFVDTKPLSLAANVLVTNIVYPTPGQTFPTSVLPVHVLAGGEVIYEVTTSGGAQAVHVEYSDGTSQDLVPKDSTLQDVCRWEGWYYPSSTETIPLTYADGTHIWITRIIVSGLGKQPYETNSDLLIIDGSISRGKLPQLAPRLVQ
ncbi:MAG TPA: fibronectin type III domain-containing protein [Alicyclobacillus sp.]|nr:fibronectin type III domain-containing protein [Alicyclobacillus sp.]